jgi:ubiquinone/menaquinone biosynthesis C-methylase UbiE
MEPSIEQAPAPKMKSHRWFAALYDRLGESEEKGFLGEMRRSLIGDLRGNVLEIGAGTGNNFPHYSVDARVTATEPDVSMRRRAEEKLFALGRSNIRLTEGPAEQLAVEAGAFDHVVSTLVLCTVSDVPRALAEIRRVLKPGGSLQFIEHVRAEGLAGTLQDLLRPIWGWFGAGCHPNRRTIAALKEAGFDVEVFERATIMGFVPVLRGAARIPSRP